MKRRHVFTLDSDLAPLLFMIFALVVSVTMVTVAFVVGTAA